MSNPKNEGEASVPASTRTIRSWSGFAKWLGAQRGWITIFRGVSSLDYKLIPRVGRPEARLRGYRLEDEVWLFNEFRARARTYLPSDTQPHDLWDWLALAQHHGLTTRLLDWTRNPLVAAYFAVSGSGQKRDGVIYSFPSSENAPVETIKHPFDVEETIEFTPQQMTRRIIAQEGTFTVHGNPVEVFKPKDLGITVIDHNWKSSLRDHLFQFGIHRASLFPELDGVSRLLNWQHYHGGDV